MMVMVVAAPVYADAGSKFQDGVERFFTSPMNIVDGVKEETEAATFKPFGVFGGLIKGLAETVVDAGGGAVHSVGTGLRQWGLTTRIFRRQ